MIEEKNNVILDNYKVLCIEVAPPNRKKKYIGLRKAILKNKDFSCIKCVFKIMMTSKWSKSSGSQLLGSLPVPLPSFCKNPCFSYHRLCSCWWGGNIFFDMISYALYCWIMWPTLSQFCTCPAHFFPSRFFSIGCTDLHTTGFFIGMFTR